MALTKEIFNDRVEVITEFKHVQVREATVIKEDGKEVSRTFRRWVHHAGTLDNTDTYQKTDVDNIADTAEVKAVCTAVWSQAVHDLFEAELKANRARQ